MQKILVTGASGFVGGHLAHALQAHNLPVRCLVRRTSRLDFIAPLNLEQAIGDITDPESLPPALEGVDAVVHCAGVTRAPSRSEYFRVNEQGSRNLLAACERSGKIRKIVFISSLGALGPERDQGPITEDSPPQPVSWYGESKLAAQRLAESRMRVLPISIIMPPAVYGPNDDDLLALFRWVRRGLMPQIGGRMRSLSLIHAGDLAEAVLQALIHDRSAGRSYLVEDGFMQTWAGVAETIARAMSRKVRILKIPTFAARGLGIAGDIYSKFSGRGALISSQKMRELLQDSWACSSRRIRDELGFRPRYSFDRGIRDTLAWYRAHRWL